jgi:hypothetical protein
MIRRDFCLAGSMPFVVKVAGSGSCSLFPANGQHRCRVDQYAAEIQMSSRGDDTDSGFDNSRDGRSDSPPIYETSCSVWLLLTRGHDILRMLISLCQGS